MNPAVLQALSPAVPVAASRQAAPGDAPADFASVLDGSVRALSGDEAGESGVHATIEGREEGGPEAGLVPAAPEVIALASDQPRLDALALMLAAAPAPPGQATPGVAATAGAGPTAAVVDALAVAAQARAALDGTAAPIVRPMTAEAPVVDPSGGLGEDAVGTPPAPAPAQADAAAELMRAAVALPGVLRREGHAAPDRSGKLPARTGEDVVNGTDTAGQPRPAAGATPSATTLSVVAGLQGASDAAPAAIAKVVPLATSAAPRAPVQPLSGDTEGETAPPAATDAADVELVAAREVSQTPPGGALPALAATAAAAPGTPGHVAPPVGSPGWAPALAQQIVRLPGGGEVELHLNPAELGPLQVKLTLVESQAQVVFVAEHSAVRQALEAALPQLRTGLAESGINLGQATVGSGAGEQRTGQDSGERPGRGAPPAAGDERVPAQPHGAAAGSGRAGAVDTFA